MLTVFSLLDEAEMRRALTDDEILESISIVVAS